MTAYYNEIDDYAADWLENLIAAGHIAPGDVDRRSIVDVQPDDVRGYRQCHFFAGIGGWSYALRLAGWPDNREVWTGSCPCQPLSSAGKRRGDADERHLWPAFYELITECRPATIFGEQVASKDGREWLAGVRADLEGSGYACGAADLCAASVGAPHIRQRLWWVANAECERREMALQQSADGGTADELRQANGSGSDVTISGPANTDGGNPSERCSPGRQASAPARHRSSADADGGAGRMGNTKNERWHIIGDHEDAAIGNAEPARIGSADGPWSEFDVIPCSDGKSRRVGTSIQPLATGVPARVGKLRAAGNAIVPQVAAEIIGAFMERGRRAR